MTKFDKNIEVGGVIYSVQGSYSDRYVDDTFSHEFGVEKCGHYKVDRITIESVYYEDSDGGDHEIPYDSFLWAKIEEELMGVLV